MICDRRPELDTENVLLVFGNKQLEKGKSLADYELENYSTLFLVLRLMGGMIHENHKELDDGVELSEQPDMITLDDDEGNPRAKMPCGHAIGKCRVVSFMSFFFPFVLLLMTL